MYVEEKRREEYKINIVKLPGKGSQNYYSFCILTYFKNKSSYTYRGKPYYQMGRIVHNVNKLTNSKF